MLVGVEQSVTVKALPAVQVHNWDDSTDRWSAVVKLTHSTNDSSWEVQLCLSLFRHLTSIKPKPFLVRPPLHWVALWLQGGGDLGCKSCLLLVLHVFLPSPANNEPHWLARSVTSPACENTKLSQGPAVHCNA